MKFSIKVACALIALVGAQLAGAAERDAGIQSFVQDQRTRPEPQREAERPVPQRDLRGSGEADRGRMNPEERRQLRRDIQDAGRDIYRPAQQGRGEGRRSGHR